jgi:hypothetical protein
MSLLARELPAPVLRRELLVVCVLAWLAFIAVPLLQGGIGLSWDALNHHIYLGWSAERPRFDRDFLGAGYQSTQFPYLYWPAYKMAVSGWSGISTGVVLATLHLVAVPPVWMIARLCMPGATVFDAAMRLLAVALAFLTGVVLSLFDSTQNDLMAAAPLVWALAFALRPAAGEPMGEAQARRQVVYSGLFAGLSVAFKLSNGPLAILLPLLWACSARTLRQRMVNVLAGGAAATLAFLVSYGYWGLQLWQHFGNPIYPFADDRFAPLRSLLGFGA